MNEYTASNGVRIEDRGGSLHANGSLIIGAGSTFRAALAEFFRAEEDERLGRWRWPDNTGYIVYPDKTLAHLVSVVDESTGLREVRSKSKAGHKRDNFERAAAAYFDAHPEPKPWHEAKPGEVWAIKFGVSEDEEIVQAKDSFFVKLSVSDRWFDTAGKKAPDITAGRRIWPES